MASQPGERVVFRGHPSWLSLRGLYARAMLLGLLAGVLAGAVGALATGRTQTWWAIAGVLGGFGWCAGRGQLRRLRTTYAVTDRRVAVSTRRLLRRRVSEAWLEEILSVAPRQSMFERMLGIGTVHVVCEEWSLALRGVDDPRGVARALQRAVHDHHDLVAPDRRIAA